MHVVGSGRRTLRRDRARCRQGQDGSGTVIDRWAPTHDEAGLAAAIRRLAAIGAACELPVAIEATHSVVIDRLLDAGHPVVPIHPDAFHATRPAGVPPGPRATG